jgi:DnaJ-class molecular chaperone
MTMSHLLSSTLAAIALALPLFHSAHAGEVPKPAVTIENPGTQCVAPAEEMRRNHMEMLKHQRKLTLREGVRGSKVSLNGCIECHASKKTGSVIGSDENFCQTCHAFAAVKLDCWDCHQPKAGYKAAGVTQ